MDVRSKYCQAYKATLNIQGKGKTSFEVCQALCMGTSKWHALSHVVDTIRPTMNVEYDDAGIYGSSRKLFIKQ